MQSNEPRLPQHEHESTAGPTVGYVGPDGSGMANGAMPVPFQLPPQTPPPDPMAMLRELAPLIQTALGAIRRPGPSEADDLSTTLEARGTLLVNHAVAIANLAHALGDMKDSAGKARVETTGALEQAITRLASACVPVVEEKPADLDEDDRAFVLGMLGTMADAIDDEELAIDNHTNEESARVAVRAREMLARLAKRWGMEPIPQEGDPHG